MTETYLKDEVFNDMEWLHLAHDKMQKPGVLNMIMKNLIIVPRIIDVVEITNTMHRFAPLLYSYMLAPTCFGSSLPSSGSF
jgi:hypothetical protein